MLASGAGMAWQRLRRGWHSRPQEEGDR
jgi:hypothetical protein